MSARLPGQQCTQVGCELVPLFRFSWPGQGQRLACANHAAMAKGAAVAIGLDLDLVPLSEIELRCPACGVELVALITPEGAR